MFDSLTVPPAFARFDSIADSDILNSLAAWKLNTEPSLRRLDSLDISTLSVSELAGLVHVLAPLTAAAHWTSPITRELASALLARVPHAEKLTVHILSQVVKPLFAATPHPSLHTSTARILSRPADVQDTYIEQPWKECPGLDEVIRWCLLNTQPSAFESAWPLFLPPIMSFLDDYQAPYKLLGVRLASELMDRVPPDLLLRTGVDTLMFSSLIHSLSHLRDHLTPDLIRLSVKTALQLIDLTTPSMFPSDGISSGSIEPQTTPATSLTHSLSPSQSRSSSTRFSRLSTLLSSALLGTVILYTPTYLPPVASSASDLDTDADPQHTDANSFRAPTEPPSPSFNPTLVAAAQMLPPVLSALGIGGARFLKGVIPVLAEWLGLPLPVLEADGGNTSGDGEQLLHCGPGSFTVDISLHLASLSSLFVLLQTCTSRIGGWSTTIVDALGHCWVECLDIEDRRRENIVLKDHLSVLKRQLKDMIIQLAKVCPAVIKHEYNDLLVHDKNLFEDLVRNP